MRGFSYLFSALLLVGGLAAYIRRGSYKSLLFSTAATILLLISASLMHHRSGKLLALGKFEQVTVKAAVLGGLSFLQSKAAMRGLPVVVITAGLVGAV
jgi:uncharacterized membrane protein (UPF0136 family)